MRVAFACAVFVSTLSGCAVGPERLDLGDGSPPRRLGAGAPARDVPPALPPTTLSPTTLSPTTLSPTAPPSRSPGAAAGADDRSPGAPVFAPGSDVAAEDRRTFEEAQRVRLAWGLRPFRWNDRLYAAAKAHSAEQERFDYMGHGSPDPARDDLADRLRIAGYGAARGWAEVVARGYDGPASVMQGWMNSRGHRKILTDPRLEEAAFARVGTSFTGNFATPMPR